MPAKLRPANRFPLLHQSGAWPNVLHIEQHKRSIWILTRHFDREVERAKRRRRTVDRDQNL